MKKVLYHFFFNKFIAEEGHLKQFYIVEDVITNYKTIQAIVLCLDNEIRTVECSISEFEHVWKINLSDIKLSIK